MTRRLAAARGWSCAWMSSTAPCAPTTASIRSNCWRGAASLRWRPVAACWTTASRTSSRWAATCLPAASSRRWSSATPCCASFPARSGTSAPRSRSPSAPRSAVLWSIRTTPARPSTGAGACPRCCSRGIMSGSASGGASVAANAVAVRGEPASPETAPGEANCNGRPLPWPFAPGSGPQRVFPPVKAHPPSPIMSSVIETIERAQLRRVPNFAPGDRVKVHFQVIEGSRRRVQVFEGVVIKRQGHGARETFTVRKQSFGVGVERMFPVHSPKIERIELSARGDVRRAKLYYLRDRVGKRARVRERRYTGPEEAVEPGLLHEPAGATDADGLTAEDTVAEGQAAEGAEQGAATETNEQGTVEQGAAAEVDVPDTDAGGNEQ